MVVGAVGVGDVSAFCVVRGINLGSVCTKILKNLNILQNLSVWWQTIAGGYTPKDDMDPTQVFECMNICLWYS